MTVKENDDDDDDEDVEENVNSDGDDYVSISSKLLWFQAFKFSI